MNDRRKKIYEWLYSDPLCKHMHINEKELNVLIVGGDADYEVFKAVFWCGQFPDTTLNIYVCCEDKGEYRRGLIEQMPGLEKFVYIDDKCIDEEVPSYKNLANIYLISVNDINNYSYDYTIKADNELNSNGGGDLGQLAENINFAYELHENERSNFEEVKDIFNPPTKENEHKWDEYNYWSSYAGAVHIPYKLKYCENEYNKINGEEMGLTSEAKLVKVINAGKDKSEKANVALAKIYNDLVVLEHHRWMAYMITEGWQQPDVEKLRNNIYIRWDDHKSKDEKFHACLCYYGDKKLTANDYKEVKENFNAKLNEYQNKGLKNLNDVSLFCYAMQCKMAEMRYKENEKKIEDGKKDKDEHKKKYWTAVDNLFKDQTNSETEYDCIFTELDLKSLVDANIENLNPKLKVVKKRNQKEDFVIIDEQFIDLMPFCLWFRKKYKTVITISGGNLYNDVAVPLLLMPEEKCVFVGVNKEDQNKIKEIFKNHGDNTKEIDFRDISYIFNEEKNDTVINIGEGATNETVLKIAEKTNLCPIVSYKYPEIKCYNGIMPSQYCLESKNLSVEEYISLCHWEGEQLGEEISYSQCEKLADLFFETSKVEGNSEKKIFYSIWQIMFMCYKKDEEKKNKKTAKNDEKDVSWNGDRISNPMKAEKLGQLVKNMPEFLDKLSEAKIIYGLKKDENRKKTKFKVEDPNLYDMLANCSGTLFEYIVYYKFKLAGLFSDVKHSVKIKVSTESKTNNEIDVVATKGMRAVFISCKTTAELKKEYIYEIASEANLFGAIPVLAVAQPNPDKTFADRAKDWGVSLLDATIIRNDDYFRDAVIRILAGEVVSPTDYKEGEEKNELYAKSD